MENYQNANEYDQNKRHDFYRSILQEGLSQGWLNQNMSILVVCGGRFDRDFLLKFGFKNVTISNLDVRMTGNEFAPYSWSFQNAENLGYQDESFDVVIVHEGLHHCSSPHKALLEMYRVSKKGILVVSKRK